MMRTWVRALVTALVTAAAAGAGQLGLAYGLGIMRWDQQFTNQNMWSAQLTWSAWIAAVAVVAGAVSGVASLRRHGHEPHLGSWLGASLAAAGGGLLTVLLVALPARAAELPQTTDSALEASLAAGFGTVVGVFAALAVLTARLIAGNIYATIGWVWALALVSATGVVAGDTPLGVQRVGVLAIPGVSDAQPSRAFIIPMIVGISALVSALIAAYGRWLGEQRVTVAISGLAGPALLAAAYLIAGPGVSSDQADQLTPYLATLAGVGAGLIASIVVALVRRPAPEPDTDERQILAPVEPELPAPAPIMDQVPRVPAMAPVRGSASVPPPPPLPPPPPPPPLRPAPSPRAAPSPRPAKATAKATAKPPPPPPPPPSVPSPRDGDYESWLSALSNESPHDDPELAKPTKRSLGRPYVTSTAGRPTESPPEEAPAAPDTGTGTKKGRGKRGRKAQADQPK